MLREIPSTAVELQTGLWGDARTLTLGNTTITKYDLYSSEGYCFYIIADNLDEDGNLLPENERAYYQIMYSAYRTAEQVNAAVVSVPVQDGYEIASGNPNTETA